MDFWFFVISVIIIVLLFIILAIYKKFNAASIVTGLVTIGYSLTSDVLFGDQFQLFHYFNPQISTLYAILSAYLIYAPLNVIYTRFLPQKRYVILYTTAWIVFMLVFEYCSLITKTIIFTGWRPLPWSIVLYIVSYLWIYYFYVVINRKLTNHQGK